MPHPRPRTTTWFVFCLLIIAAPLEARDVTGVWVPAGKMATVRSAASAVVLLDGRVLITGGSGADGPLATAEVYKDGAFVEAPSMNIARSGHASVRLIGGRVLVVGGRTTDGQPTWSAELFDPVTNTWSSAGDLARARVGHTATRLHDGRVLIAGGESIGNVTDTVEIFDPRTGRFANIETTLSSPRANHAAVALRDGRVLLISGDDGNAVLSSIDVFDLRTGRLAQGPELLTPRTGHTATLLLTGDVLIAGGSNGRNELGSAEIFDARTGTLSRGKGNLARHRRDHVALRLPDNNSVLLIGGTFEGKPVAEVELYRPWITNARLLDRLKFWQSAFEPAATLIESRGRVAGVAVASRGEALVFGGEGRSTAERYDYAQLKTDRKFYTAGENIAISGSGWRPGGTITLRFDEDPSIHSDRVLQAKADEQGNFSISHTVEPHDEDVRVFITASAGLMQAQVLATTQVEPSIRPECTAEGQACDPEPDDNACEDDICISIGDDEFICQENFSGFRGCPNQCERCDPAGDPNDPCTTDPNLVISCEDDFDCPPCFNPADCPPNGREACVNGTCQRNTNCTDANACTTNDVCQDDGTCDGDAVSCDDGDACTSDDCDPTTGSCSNPNICEACKVTGGGQVTTSGPTPATTGKKATFGFNAHPGPKGHFNWVIHKTKNDPFQCHVEGPVNVSVACTTTSNGGEATFKGTCKQGGCSTFEVTVQDKGEPGKNDMIKVTIVGGSCPGTFLKKIDNGNIQVHRTKQ